MLHFHDWKIISAQNIFQAQPSLDKFDAIAEPITEIVQQCTRPKCGKIKSITVDGHHADNILGHQ